MPLYDVQETGFTVTGEAGSPRIPPRGERETPLYKLGQALDLIPAEKRGFLLHPDFVNVVTTGGITTVDTIRNILSPVSPEADGPLITRRNNLAAAARSPVKETFANGATSLRVPQSGSAVEPIAVPWTLPLDAYTVFFEARVTVTGLADIIGLLSGTTLTGTGLIVRKESGGFIRAYYNGTPDYLEYAFNNNSKSVFGMHTYKAGVGRKLYINGQPNQSHTTDAAKAPPTVRDIQLFGAGSSPVNNAVGSYGIIGGCGVDLSDPEYAEVLAGLNAYVSTIYTQGV